MIKNFKCSETKKIGEGHFSKKLPHDVQQVARRKLRMLNNAQDLNDLSTPPANKLEPLKGDRIRQFSIRINNQWGICFSWTEGDAFNVEIIDYP